ncbi:MAG: bifunctional [glutamate--ammonia ligase]-adenylyl-L-tyrosine phosphorylase/[glutamate--ammonia-ligase] adenylyltransferase [Proteobacteria bacterium]|nr:bifunctional [glutamate--ammonia ligase]-adenylyl-L-tyrosine phosphorylase/[glutamate--ammonia-ligase] adenylyltransferase [Pseudomonadota bacterium]
MTDPTLTPALASRFFTRWLHAETGRAALIEHYIHIKMSPAVFAEILQMEAAAGMPLPRATRRLRNLVIAQLIARDLSERADLDEVVATSSALAECIVQTHLQALSIELAERHGTPIGQESGKPQEMIVLGMGKLGGRELNVSSDIDLIFVYPEDGETAASGEQQGLSNHEFFTRLGKKLINAIADLTEDGFSFRVDMALRPNGASGPLVASFGMIEEYLMVQGREWERYAWVKARALTGQPDDIAALDKIVQPFVYRRYLDFGAIEAMRTMHAQIRAEVVRQETRHPHRVYNVKLGRGGIREIEFLAQVFQLIRGGRDPELRDRSTRETLRTLARKQLLDADVVWRLLEIYSFLRDLEHRLQYLDDAQTHVLPANEADRQLIAGMMGFADVPALLAALEERCAFVAAQFDAIFSDKNSDDAGDESGKGTPDLPSLLCGSEAQQTVGAHLATLGFAESDAAAQRLLASWQSTRIQSLSEAGRNRVLALTGAALPMIAACPDEQLATLNRLLDFLEAIARRSAYLALLSEYPHTLRRVVRMMHASRWAAQYLTRHPILLDELLDDRTLTAAPDWAAFGAELQRQLDAHAGDTEHQMNILRDMHHAQLIRLLAQDIEGQLTVERLADHLSALADVLVGATVKTVWQSINQRHRETPQFAVIAYGKLGGKELGYASDLDVIFLYDDDDQEAPMHYAKLAQRFITWMTSHTSAGILFDIDIALRPDGASGLLVTSVASFEKYQKESAWLWEHQALTRARFCSGDASIGTKFEAIRETVLRQPREEAPLKEEVLAMREKMRTAHPNRSGQFDLKHDAGGMIDIEFMVQYLVLRHAAQYPQLTADIGNIALLKLCGTLGLIDAELAGKVADAYRSFRKMQHQIRLQGEDKARVSGEWVEKEIAAVKQLWKKIFYRL